MSEETTNEVEETPIVEEAQATEETKVEEINENEISEEELSTLEKQEQVEKQLLRKLQLKIDGQEVEEELPFDIDPAHAEWMKKQLQLARVSQKRMQETANERKSRQGLEDELKDFVLALRENPSAVLSDPRLGIDLKNLAQQVMNKELEEASKSPEQKEKEEREQELESLRKKIQEKEEREKMLEMQRMEDEMSREYEEQVIRSIETNGLQKDPRVIKRYADAMKSGLKYNIQLTADELGPIIKKQMYDEARFYANQLTDDDLDDFLGKDRLSRVRKSMIAKLRKKLPSKQKIADTGGKELNQQQDIDPFAKKKEYKRSKNFFKNLKKNY